MSFFQRRNNDAVRDNPPVANGREADIHITEHGSDVSAKHQTLMGFC